MYPYPGEDWGNTVRASRGEPLLQGHQHRSGMSTTEEVHPPRLRAGQSTFILFLRWLSSSLSVFCFSSKQTVFGHYLPLAVIKGWRCYGRYKSVKVYHPKQWVFALPFLCLFTEIDIAMTQSGTILFINWWKHQTRYANFISSPHTGSQNFSLCWVAVLATQKVVGHKNSLKNFHSILPSTMLGDLSLYNNTFPSHLPPITIITIVLLTNNNTIHLFHVPTGA